MNFQIAPSLVNAASADHYGTRTLAAAATIPTLSTFVFTAGYAAVGDGGGALYKKVGGAPPSHAGKFQSADGAHWEIAEANPNIKMFGAVMDGSTDDLTAINNAITYVNGLGGGTVFVPEGTAIVGGAVMMKNNVTLRGYGITSIIKLKALAHTSVITCAAGAHHLRILDLAIDGNRTGQTPASSTTIDGISIVSILNVLPEDDVQSHDISIGFCYIHDFREHGIECSEGTYNVNIFFNTIEGSDLGAGIDGARGGGLCYRFIIQGNNVRNTEKQSIGATSHWHDIVIAGNFCGATGVVTGGASAADNITCYADGNYNISITGNICEDSGNHGIHIAGSRLSITGNTINSPTNDGITVGAQATFTCSDVSVTGNTITGAGRYGIGSQDVKNYTCSGNAIIGSDNFGIIHNNSVNSASDIFTITGNSIRSSVIGDGILINGATYGIDMGVIAGNICVDNNGDGISLRNAPGSVGHTQINVNGNTCVNNGGWGISEENHSTDNLYANNYLLANPSGGILLATGSTSTVKGGASNAAAGVNTIALTGSTLSLPADAGDPGFVRVSAASTQTVTTIAGAWPGRLVTLYFVDNNVTLNHGAAIFLAGGTDKVMTSRDVVQLVSEGTSWFQVSAVSVN